jgi:long-subunit fatty acid transport protein
MRVEPVDIYILELPGIPRYKVPPVSERLGFRDALSAHVGGELELPRWGLTLRAGYSYERGAVTPAARSTMAHDPNKHLLSLGGSLTWRGLRLDVAYAAMLTAAAVVDFRASEARQINPIRPELAARVGGGAYSATAHVISAGGQMRF